MPKLCPKVSVRMLTMIIDIIIILQANIYGFLYAKDLVSSPEADQGRVLIYQGTDMAIIFRARPDR